MMVAMTIRDRFLIFFTLVRIFPVRFAVLALLGALCGFAVANLLAGILFNYFSSNFPVRGVLIVGTIVGGVAPVGWLGFKTDKEEKS
jgi:hypothetical protein